MQRDTEAERRSFLTFAFGAVQYYGYSLCQEGKAAHEAHVSTEYAQAREETRVPFSHGHEGGSPRARRAPRQGAQAPLRVGKALWVGYRQIQRRHIASLFAGEAFSHPLPHADTGALPSEPFWRRERPGCVYRREASRQRRMEERGEAPHARGVPRPRRAVAGSRRRLSCQGESRVIVLCRRAPFEPKGIGGGGDRCEGDS